MLKQLEIDALRADLVSVSRLVDGLSEAEDPVGRFQLLARKEMIEKQLQDVVDRPSPPALGLFFDGRPVIGSRGILAEFGSKVLEEVANVIATRFASREGPLRARGPIPQRRQAQMFVTDVVRGSFGFVLESSSFDDAGDNAAMKEVISEVVDLLYRASDQDADIFEEVIANLDDRTVASLLEFYRLLENNEATLRIVESEKDLKIDRDDVRRGRERVEAITSIESNTVKARGRLYVMPESMKFELVSPGTIWRGAVTKEAIASLPSQEGNIGVGALATWCNVEIETRTIKRRGRDPRYNFTLLRVLSSGDMREHDNAPG
jgi:hypothetical protein